MMKIVTTPNKVLIIPVKKVAHIDQKVKKIIEEMKNTLENQRNPEGVGLAAPQIGYSLAIFISKPTPKSPINTFINPVILKLETANVKQEKNKKQQKKTSALEGCLSIPKIWSPIKRPEKVLLKYQSVEGQMRTEWFEDFEATIIQHEVDHLQGKLFTQIALEQCTPLYEEKNGKFTKLEF